MLDEIRVVEGAVQADLSQEQVPVILFLLGGVDVGKTFTVTALANRFNAQGQKVAVVDADVGQSDIGPPCCIGMGIPESEIQTLSEVPLHSLYFVGGTSPSGCMRECVEGAAAAVQAAKKINARVIIVDSTGWIEGEEAKLFKLLEINAIAPSLVVAIEREDELGHIIPHLNSKVITLRVSGEARSRTREERRALREAAFTNYFRAAKARIFKRSLFAWLPEEGTIVGLFSSKRENEEEEIAGLGIVRDLDYENGEAVVLTPVDAEPGDDAAVSRMKPGVVRLIKENDRLKEFKLSQYLLSKSNSQPAEDTDK